MKNELIISLLAVIITAIVSGTQIWIENINKNKELELEKLKFEQNYKLNELHEEREWKYKLMDFMAKYRKLIFSKNLNNRENIQKIMMISFPKNIIVPIFEDLSKITKQEDWKKAGEILKRLGKPTVYIQIVKGFPEEIIEAIDDTLAEGDISYFTNDEYVDDTITQGDVRYFFKSDKKLAQTVLKDFEELACSEGYKLKLKLIPLIHNNDRNIKGTIEVWLSPKSIKKVINPKDNCFSDFIGVENGKKYR